MNSKKYDVAFAPINPRLIQLSFRLSKLLESKGISCTILKTSLISSEHNGWEDYSHEDGHSTPITSLDEINYFKKSNFFSYSFRIIKSRISMNSFFKPNFKSLVVFMDDYAEAEVLIPILKKKKVPTILFQEGFFVNEIQYHFNAYSLAKYIRSKLLGNFFTSKKYGENSDYIFTLSHFGFKEYLDRIKISESKIKIIGNPNKINQQKTISKKKYENILINHSPLAPRFSTKKWEDKLWISLMNVFDDMQYKLSIKPHPRIGFNNINKLVKENKSRGHGAGLRVLDRKISAETLYNDFDVLINIFSASSFEALYKGIPVIFIKSQFNNVKLLEVLVKANEIIMVDDVKEIPEILNKLNSNYDYRNEVIRMGFKAAEKLGGELNIFDDHFPAEIKKIIEAKNYENK